MKIKMLELVGDFGEDKDVAASTREKVIKPALRSGEQVVLDFLGVSLATQSFIHALISDVLRTSGEDVLDQLTFDNCSEVVKGIISTVVQYSLDSIFDDEAEARSGG